MLTILLRTLIIYLTLVVTMRVMGKRQLGELEVSELVTTLLLSEVASLPITNQDIPLAFAIVPVLTLMSLEVLLSGLLLHIPALKKALSVRPTILIRHGKPDAAAMKKKPHIGGGAVLPSASEGGVRPGSGGVRHRRAERTTLGCSARHRAAGNHAGTGRRSARAGHHAPNYS